MRTELFFAYRELDYLTCYNTQLSETTNLSHI